MWSMIFKKRLLLSFLVAFLLVTVAFDRFLGIATDVDAAVETLDVLGVKSEPALWMLG